MTASTIMTALTLSRLAIGAGCVLIFGATALAQTSPSPAPAAAPPAPQFAPTATITTPGYPGVGAADPKLRIANTPDGKKLHLLPATLDTTQWGWLGKAEP